MNTNSKEIPMTSTSTAAKKLARRAGLVAAAASLALMVAPTTGLAKAPVKFGAKLDPTVQPSNSTPAHPCSQEAAGQYCTMIENDAYGRPGVERAPKSGRIRAIRVIAGGPGSFQLQIAKVRKADDYAKVVRTGPKLAYQGQSEANWESDNYNVEKFKVNVPVRKGQQLALLGNYTSMVRCSSGGDNTLIYQPFLRPGNPFQPATDTDGCWILMEAVIR
jgi:hypothetical protein